MKFEMTAKQRGAYGESLAATEYRRQGYELIDANWHCRHGEIDLILAKNKEYVFCEVKTRVKGSLVSGAEAVNMAKQGRIIKAAGQYAAQQNISDEILRFDVAEVILSGSEETVEIIENAFSV